MAVLCSGQRCRLLLRLALILYVVLLLTAAAILIWAGLYLYFIPAIASVAPLIFCGAIACNRTAASAVKTGSEYPSSPSPSVSHTETHLHIANDHLQLNHHPTVRLIKRHGATCINLQPWRHYTHHELIAATNNFDDSNLVGKGGQATVFRGVELLIDEDDADVGYGRNIAVKRFYFVSENAEDLHHANSEFKREVQALSRASHRNVVEFYGYCIHGRERLLVFELMPNGSLHDLLFPAAGERAVPTLDWGQRLTIARDAARGLDYLHNYCNLNLVHLDIKPQNILLDEMLHAKIADFGLSMLIGKDQAGLTGLFSMVGGTPGYRAPELNSVGKGWENNITKKADVYSFGIVLLQLASGRVVGSSPTVDSAAPTFVAPGQTFRDAAFHLVKTQQTCLLIDGSLDKAACNSKVGQRMLEIGAMCVEIDPADRPDMHQTHRYRVPGWVQLGEGDHRHGYAVPPRYS